MKLLRAGPELECTGHRPLFLLAYYELDLRLFVNWFRHIMDCGKLDDKKFEKVLKKLLLLYNLC